MTPKEAMSVGIIGGADGPTAIYVSGDPLFLPIVGAVAVVCIAAIVFLIKRKKK